MLDMEQIKVFEDGSTALCTSHGACVGLKKEDERPTRVQVTSTAVVDPDARAALVHSWDASDLLGAVEALKLHERNSLSGRFDLVYRNGPNSIAYVNTPDETLGLKPGDIVFKGPRSTLPGEVAVVSFNPDEMRNFSEGISNGLLTFLGVDVYSI